MERKKAVLVGLGNIGRYALEALNASQDLHCIGIVRRNPSESCFDGVPVVRGVDELGEQPDVAILAVPSREVERVALEYLSKGISTVDSFDIHPEIPALRERLSAVTLQNGVVSVISAGWDPGSDSVVRTLLEAMIPSARTFTNFGPGRSMGHTVAVKSIAGVKDALSMTIPMGGGVHSRKVYVELLPGFEFDAVAASIKSDPYFVHDDTVVEQVPDVKALDTMMHGVEIVRDNGSGQSASFGMRINNPRLTGQVLVCAARAALRQAPGCYVLPEIPVIDLLEGSREDAIRRLV